MRQKINIVEDVRPREPGIHVLTNWFSSIAAFCGKRSPSTMVLCLLIVGVVNTAFTAAPSITTQPTNQTVVAGNSATFSVTASGTLLGYQWYQNGSPILLAIGTSYIILGATAASAGNYTVVVSSLGGSVTSNPAMLVVNKAPATMILSNLVQVYNGTAKSVSVNTAPVGLILNLTYNGSFNAPTNPGAYAVSATIIDLSYIGSVTNTLVILPASTTNQLSTSSTPAATTSNVTFTATLVPVSPGGGVPTGNVIFRDGTTTLATRALNGAGTATFSTTGLTHGNHAIQAEYAGDNNFTGSTNSLNELIDSAPVVVAQTWGRTPNTVLKIRTTALLAGDTDADNDPLRLISTATSSTAGGQVTVFGSWILYSPPTGYTNADNFSYVIADGGGLEATGMVAVSVLINTNATQNIGGMRTMPNGALIHFNAIPGRTCTVQCTSNLSIPNWQPLGTATTDPFGKFDFTDTAATNLTQRYYRSAN